MRRDTVLAVCTANICRSPVMELLLRDRLDETRYEIASAGVRGWDGAPVDSMVRLELVRLGIDSVRFRSRPLRPELVDAADLILTATRQQRGQVLEVDPGALRRTFTLLEFAELTRESEADTLADLAADASQRRSSGPTRADVPDPYMRPPSVHREVVDLIDDAVSRVVTTLQRVGTREVPPVP